ncbi:MAG: hypothetical protein LBC43_03115 [Bifidobacteriaceae bacterium]|nr:hypothetical protein [Bifidobacteriaceae bacterium]
MEWIGLSASWQEIATALETVFGQGVIQTVMTVGGMLGALAAFQKRVIAWLKEILEIDQIRCEILQNRLLQNIHFTPDKASVIETDQAA